MLFKNLLKLAMILMIVSSVASCASQETRINTHMIPVMAEPVIPPEPQAPDLASQLPPTITLTPDEVAYYKEVCDAWESNEHTKADMEENFPGLPRGAACDWAIKGYTIQGSLTVEAMWNQSAHYAESMRAYV